MRLEILINPLAKTVVFDNATVRLSSDVAFKSATTFKQLTDLIEDTSATGFVRRYRKKAQKASEAVEKARQALLLHRNLDEDYCTVKVVGVDEVAVCADVEVAPDADIEWVQARIWFEIEQYFDPSIRFNTLQEMLDAGIAVEDIFNGPELDNGFVTAKDLHTAAWVTVLRVSDVINRLMDIEGVIAVNQLQLTKYDDEGNIVKGAADPTWSSGNAVFDQEKSSASWLLFVSKQHQPRLYLNFSRFLFYKNGLPFLPRMDEALDTLNRLRGDAERPDWKIRTTTSTPREEGSEMPRIISPSNIVSRLSTVLAQMACRRLPPHCARHRPGS